MKTLIAIALATAACTTTPDVPTWQGDVMPLFASNCARCHGRPAAFGAPPGFRLDVWEDTPDPDHPGLVIRGAGTMTERAYDRVNDGSMPPIFETVNDAAIVLHRWSTTSIDAAAGTPKTPAAIGAPRAANHAPTIAVTPGANEGDFAYEIDDADFDSVYGMVVVDGPGSAAPIVLAYDLKTGRGRFHVNTDALAAGTYAMRAVLDDGSAPIDAFAKTNAALGGISQPIGDLIVAHAGGAAPVVAIALAYPYELSAGGTLTIDATATDLDDAIVKLELHLFRLGDSKAPGLDLALDPTQPIPSLDVHAIAPADDWVLELDATDAAGHTTAARSTQLVIAHGDPAATSFNAVKGLLNDECAGCHDPCASTFAIPNMLHAWTGPHSPVGTCLVAADGVADGNNPGLIYDHVFRRHDMPPANQRQLDASQLATLRTYLEAGAPP
jgi:hypothetical protein